MKVGLVCPYNMYKGGGVQECVLAIQAELEKRGHTARIITPQPFKTNGMEAKPGVVFIGTAAQIRSPFHTTAQVSVSVKIDSLEKVLEDEQFDVLHFHEPWVPIMSKQILSRSKSANIATFHAKLPDTVMSRTIEKVITPYTKSILKDLDHLTAVSDAAADYVKSLTDKKINIIPNGIDSSKYLAKKKPTKPTILYVGRLEKRKGVKYLLEAFSKVTMPGAKLVIAGDGPDKNRLEQYAIQLGVKNVKFLGYVTDKQKMKLFEEARVFCSPALYGESFGIVLLEAMAMGVPVVAGDNPGYRAVMQGVGSTGLVNPKDSRSFARTLDLMLSNNDIRELWLRWAEDYVKQFDYVRVVDRYEILYKQALNKK